MHRAFWTALAATALTIGAAGTANASDLIEASCDSVTDSDTAGCLYSGNINGNPDPTNQNGFKFAEAEYNVFANSSLVDNVVPITLNWITKSDDGDFGNFGSITVDPGGLTGTFDLSGWNLEYFAVKAGNEFVLYEYLGTDGTGSWSVGSRFAMSHIAFFGTQNITQAPEPGTWGMMLLGFGGIGMAIRRRRRQNGEILQLA